MKYHVLNSMKCEVLVAKCLVFREGGVWFSSTYLFSVEGLTATAELCGGLHTFIISASAGRHLFEHCDSVVRKTALALDGQI